MKYDCEVIEDLLPLYIDNACSDKSKKTVDEHLEECPKCRDLLTQLKDMSIDELMVNEKNEVIGSQSKFFKRKSALVGAIIAGVFMIPILVCLIVNLAAGNGLSWFFLVLAGMFVPASLFVVPLMAPKNKMFLTMTLFTASVILLEAVICLYSGENWFFIPGSGTLFGLTVLFAPFIVNRPPVAPYLKDRKGLAVMAAYTLTYFLMPVGFRLTLGEEFPMKEFLCISITMWIVLWIIFLILRYLPGNKLTKAGAVIATIFVSVPLTTEVILFILTQTMAPWEVTVVTQPSLDFTFIGTALGLALAGIGILTKKIGGKNS